MLEEQFNRMLKELMEKINEGPGSHIAALTKLSKRTNDLQEMNGLIRGLVDSLSSVRIIIQYLSFDLEATRRERDELRAILGDQD